MRFLSLTAAPITDPADYAERVGRAMMREVLAMYEGKDLSHDAGTKNLFSNTTGGNWSSTTFVPNSSLWCSDIRDQLTGVPMWTGGNWGPSYGLMPITRRHGISCGHNGPGMEGGSPSHTVRYVHTDGSHYDARIKRWINDSVANAARSSDTPVTPQVADISIYLFDADLPSWVNVYPILSVSSALQNHTVAAGIPLIGVSQGGPNPYYYSPEYANDPLHPENIYLTYPECWTPHNREAYICEGTGGALSRFVEAKHTLTVGDSGTGKFILLGGVLYLVGLMGACQWICDFSSYINSMIGRADTADGIWTGYTVSVVVP